MAGDEAAVVAAIPEPLFQHCLISVVLNFTAAGTPLVREVTRQIVISGHFLNPIKPKIQQIHETKEN
jgi:hypothetical protein